ncbi:S26 family signal peptidase [Halobacteriales archaeon SW_10_66_29]|nr:MAG: S26 family signal peptidase [Halobacteriales archaeon SW_10_66_29]
MTAPGEDEPDPDVDPDDRPSDDGPHPETDRIDSSPTEPPDPAPADPGQESGVPSGDQESPRGEPRDRPAGEPQAGKSADEGYRSGTGRGDAPRRAGAGTGGDYQARARSGTVRDQGHRTEDEGDDWTLVVRDVAVTVLAVMLVGAYLFAISGVWPPMVAIESGSMEPNMAENDMVFVMDERRFQPAAATGDTGVVTARTGDGTGYGEFGNSGDVIIYEPGGSEAQTPIIHRAMFWVEEGENWCEQANPAYLGTLDPGDETCEADHAGFITKGDANSNYDQASIGRAGGPVRPEWIIGTAELRLPKLGWFRLQF